MQKRLLSLLLVACMLLTAIPVLALSVLAEEAEINPATSTNFSFDPSNPNFPTFDLPAATEDSEYVAVNGIYDYSEISKGTSKGGAVTYHGNWTVGSLGLTCDMATGALTFGTIFSAFSSLSRPSDGELVLTDGKGAWTSGSPVGGGALPLNASLNATLTAPINYTKVTADDNADPRNASSYYATTSVRYTAEYTGVISISAALAFAYDNGIDLVVLHNGVVVATVENNDPEKTIGIGANKTESFDYGTLVSGLAVTQGDTIDFAMAGDIKYGYENVGADFDYNKTKRGARNFSFTVSYEEGWTFIDYDKLFVMSTWDQSNADCLTVSGNARETLRGVIHTFYKWYMPDGTPMKYDNFDYLMVDDCYAKINPDLYAEGVFTEDMSWDELWDAYGEYMASVGSITFGNNWSVGNLVNGVYQEVAQRLYMYSKGVYSVRMGSKGIIYTADWDSQFATSMAVVQPCIDEYVTLGKQAVQPGDDGVLTFAEIKEVYSVLGTSVVANYQSAPGAGGLKYSGGTYGLRPNPDAPVALRYTVGEGVYGTAHIDLGNYLAYLSGEVDGALRIAVNGETVWPADATAEDKTTWYVLDANVDVAALTETLNAVTFDVMAGDEVDIILARGTTGAKKIHMDIKPTIVIEKKYVVEFKDQNGTKLYSTVVKPGAAMPAAPIGNVGGYYINDATEPVTTLPDTVEGNTFITYAGELSIADVEVEKASISVDDDFTINLYLRGDAYATAVGFGAFLDGYDISDAWGVKQADGTFKVSISGLAAKDLNQSIEVYLYQQFEGGYEGFNAENYYIKATDILKTYTTDAAYADVKDLAAAAIDYAAAAEEYFYGTALEADVAARLATYDAAIAGLSKDVAMDGDFYDYAISAATVVLKDQAAIKIRINLATYDFLDDEIFDLVVKVTSEDGEDIERTGFNYQVGSEFNGVPLNAVLVLNPINAADYDKVWEITIYDDTYEQMSGTLSYSVNTYIARTFEGGAGETDNLLRAMYAFGVAADAYQA